MQKYFGYTVWLIKNNESQTSLFKTGHHANNEKLTVGKSNFNFQRNANSYDQELGILYFLKNKDFDVIIIK